MLSYPTAARKSNWIRKFRESSIISEKPVYLPKCFKLCRAPTTIEFNIFAQNLFVHAPYLTMPITERSGFFFSVSLDLELLIKTPKICFLRICRNKVSFFKIFVNNSRSKENKANIK